MKKDWLWDQNISESEIKEVFSDINHQKFISLSATLLSRKNSAKEVFTDYIKREDFFVCWTRIKKRMRKNSWNDPRIEYWQAIYETLRKEFPELAKLKQKKFDETIFPFYREKGKEIQEARKKLGLTQKEFAKKLGVSQQIISRIERGKQNTSYKTLEPICKLLGISLDLDKKEKPDVTSTKHILPFGSLSWDQFERLCYWVIKRSNEFDVAEYYAGVGDKTRDIIGYKHKVGKKETWYFQCKNYKKIHPGDFKKELDKTKKHSEEDEYFKPDVIVFITGCSVSANCKDEVKKHAKKHSLERVFFWTDVELDERAKSTGADEEFFDKGISGDDLTKSVEEAVISGIRQSGLMGLSENSVRTDVINREIDNTVTLIHKNELEKAKEELNKILGKIENDRDKYGYELARTYNNLGVCYNVAESEGGNSSKAEEYFHKALDVNPDFLKSKANLTHVYVCRGGKDNLKKAYDIALPLWEESDKTEPLFLQAFIWSLHLHKSVKDAIKYYENSSKAKALVDQNENLLNTMGNLYLIEGNFNKAEELTGQALNLSPDSPFCLSLKARIHMGRAQKEACFPSDFEIMPRFRDYSGIEKALDLLKQALRIAEKENRRYLENQIKHTINICSLWIGRVDGNYRINDDGLAPEQQREHRALEFYRELRKRNFEEACDKLIKSPQWSNTSYGEKNWLASIFFLRGAPKQARDILKRLEEEANQEKDFQFWINRSLIEVLLDNKILAIDAATRAKNIPENEEDEKYVLQHFNALMERYVPSGEADRLMEGLSEYDNKYPEDKVLRRIKAIDDRGELTEEIKTILLKRKSWLASVRQAYKSHTITTYHLERISKKPYAEILSYQNDLELTFDLNNTQIEEILRDNFEKTQHLVFDYASLLNFSRMNLLGYLEESGKKLYIAKELFDKIQYELLSFEQEDLRMLWRYLRSSKGIVIEDVAVSEAENAGNIFDKWIVDSIKLAKEKNAIFVTDDLRFMRFLLAKNIRGCNSLIMLKVMFEKKRIDYKVYSTSIGVLAERLYTFIPFTGDDLFQIVMEDKSKITLRSYHLTKTQLFLPGSVVSSFTEVFVRFLDLLWQTGSLPEDKIKWLSFLTDTVFEFTEKKCEVQNINEFKKFVPDLVQMWVVAVQRSNREEIDLLEKETNKILNKPYLEAFSDNIAKFIQNKKESFKPK